MLLGINLEATEIMALYLDVSISDGESVAAEPRRVTRTNHPSS